MHGKRACCSSATMVRSSTGLGRAASHRLIASKTCSSLSTWRWSSASNCSRRACDRGVKRENCGLPTASPPLYSQHAGQGS
eukprot:scaffold12689_cov74-Isochrysis_galbana.AAC.1